MLIPSRAPHPISTAIAENNGSMKSGVMRLRPAGPAAFIIEVSDPDRAQSLADFIRRHLPEVIDVVPAARSVLVDGIQDSVSLRELLRDWATTPTPVPASSGSKSVITIPVHYDGPDLEDVAQTWGLEVADAIALHASIEFRAAFCGFSPGFTYLLGLPSALALSRLPTPRTRVPPGAVAIADAWCGVYPASSPGGWRILGTATAQLWDPTKSPPALIMPGARVRFVNAS